MADFAYTNGSAESAVAELAENGAVGSDAEAADGESDPEVQAEVNYAKEHGADPHAVPMRQRLKLLRKTKSAEEPVRQTNGVIQVPRSQKNQRRPRTAKGKGPAKKGGNGGKWTWGAAQKLYEEPEFVDSDDPNYDSDAQAKAVKFQSITPEIDEMHYERFVESILLEFFENGDAKDAADSIDELHLSKGARPGVVRLAVTLSIDRKPSARELTSQFLAELKAEKILSAADFYSGFRYLLTTDLGDLSIDYPSAAEYVGNFLARAIADEVLPANFLDLERDNMSDSEWAKKSLDLADALLLRKHRLDTVWISGGANKPVRYLVTKIKQLIDEYLSSGDVNEATRCLVDLEVPHFHHEVVFQAGVVTIEAMHERTARLLAKFLAHLHTSSVLTVDAISGGFDRLYAAMPDLCLDVPPAYTLLERWLAACRDEGFLPADVARKMPQKGRKRFVSEGDGGRLKVVDVPHPLI